MNKTPKYHLNQWELTDRIQMEDFNADNAHLEQALDSLQAGSNSLDAGLADVNAKLADLDSRKLEVVELLDESVTLTEEDRVMTWQVPMHGVKPGNYFAVFIEIEAAHMANLVLGNSSSSVAITQGRSSFFLLPMRRPESSLVFLPASKYDAARSVDNRSYSYMEKLSIQSNGVILKGTFGIRITAIP